ncbi:aminoacetone oxidase family FAD-binding enzyme [Peptoniphilus equinus]|uniref:Aminoacetone oxidase family FAD-binding enzyme n=1 Tax=Peptoniphilus equinus TaxID=3016343 RepID=A0ABY7QUM1_9FIRM|nr:aminoacetone oxidase family FAD-binding enzyme [Peptoniphilus equinus]WBW50478.1 aminoacetone oxidase family FAD-binding enzyme [Peptoniphilus equinus]
MKTILVIGGGAAGVIASIELARRGHHVILLEKKERILKKVLTTGNGRCNLTNINLDVSGYNDAFVADVLEQVSWDTLVHYLQTLGIYTVIEGDRVYPVTLKASTVVNLLIKALDDVGVEVRSGSPVTGISKQGKTFCVRTNETAWYGDGVVYACGGASMPKLGTDGKAFKLLTDLGHTVTPLTPGLTQVTAQVPKGISGVKVVTGITLFDGEKVIAEDRGEVLFTDYGLSGPPVLNVSKWVPHLRKPHVVFSLLNHLGGEGEDLLYAARYTHEDYTVGRFLESFIDKKLIFYVLRRLGLRDDVVLAMLDEATFAALATILLRHDIVLTGVRGLDFAQITCGGVNLHEVDSTTLESKLVPGLYILGEALNINGICGGYNLHWAMSSALCMSKAIGGI